MERMLYNDSFEKMLKDKSDEFRMYPTSRIWHSIYNNIYPGRRWPSAIIGILFITALPLIGFLNTRKNTSAQASDITLTKTINTKIPSSLSAKSISGIVNSVDVNKVTGLMTKALKNQIKLKPLLSTDNTSSEFTANTLSNKKNIGLPNKADYLKENINPPVTENNASLAANNIIEKKSTAQYNSINDLPTPSERWTDKLAVQIYASPSIIYGVGSGSQLNAASVADANNVINNNPSIGLEAGTAMQYSLSNFIKVKAGLQFNYASYDIAAFQNAAPSALNDLGAGATPLMRPSDYLANGNSSIIHNEMYQFSLPVGLELKLLKYNNLQWNAGATIQPTFIAGGNAYALSSDSHSNYIDESSLINRWNLNAGLETFITYKVNGITWQLGPQFRYQFSSTYGKGYSGVDEKVAVFGVKIGVTKVLH